VITSAPRPVRARLVERALALRAYVAGQLTWPLRRVLFRGRIDARGARVPLSVWHRVRRTGFVRVGAGTEIEPGAIDAVQGRLELGPDCVLRRAERLRIWPNGVVRTGARCVIDTGARILVFGELHLGDDVYIGRDVVISVHEHVSIGSGTLLGERVSIHDANHGPPEQRDAFRSQPVRIGARAWIAAGVVLVAGAEVGAGTTVAANAAVAGRLPDDVLAGGVPARVIRCLADDDRSRDSGDERTGA